MTEKDKRTQWKGDVLSFTDLIEEPNQTREDLYCLTMPQSKALIAAIELYRYVTRWEGGAPVREDVENFVNDTQRRLMMPCGDDNGIVLTQWTEEGHYQESTDGGETYHDAPTKDPRNSVTLPPPFLPSGTVEAECTYADSVVNQAINSWINATGEGEDLATFVSGVLAFIGGIFGAAGAVIVPIILVIGATVVEFGVTAWKAAFTSDVWDRLRCNIHDNQSADGSFTVAQVDAIYARLSDDETGIVLITLQRLIAALGAQGLTISARSGFGSPTAECCPVEMCDNDWTVAQWGSISGPDSEGFYTLTSGSGNGHQAIDIWTVDINTCCMPVELEIVSGAINLGFTHVLCGEARTIDNLVPSVDFVGGPQHKCINYFVAEGSSAFVAKVRFENCDE